MNPTLFSWILAAALAPDPVESSICVGDLRAHVYFLAADSLRGRAAGSAEEALTARYLAETLSSFGVKPAGAGGEFLQFFEEEDASGEDKIMRNVAGWIEGSDANLRHEYVVLGAHFDHVGMGGPHALDKSRETHNGADDNGSGTASVLELAQAFAMSPPKRSILILHFSAEEIGLLGAKAYCENPLRPLANAIAMINMDMVGRSQGRYLFVGGTGTAEGFTELVQRHAAPFALNLETGAGGLAPSDNSIFFLQKIPVLFLFTNIHQDYHAAGDDWWKLEYESQEAITRSAYRIARELADAAKRPVFRDEASVSWPKDFMARMMDLMAKNGMVPDSRKKGNR